MDKIANIFKGENVNFFILILTLLIADSTSAAGSEFKFVNIKSGSFMMGSPINEAGRHIGEVLHKVNITKDFQLQTTEVIQAQWFEVMGQNPSIHKHKSHCPSEYIETNGVALCPNYPVEFVTHDESTLIALPTRPIKELGNLTEKAALSKENLLLKAKMEFSPRHSVVSKITERVAVQDQAKGILNKELGRFISISVVG